MQCRDVRELAESLLAGELPTEPNDEVLRHLAGCPECRRDMDERRALKTAVKRGMLASADLAARPEFLARLRSGLQAEHAAPAPTFWNRRARWGLAAAAVLVIGVAIFGLQRAAVTSLARDAAGDHRNCALAFKLAEAPIPLEEAARRYGPAYEVLARLPPGDVRTAAGPAHVVARHSCVFAGRRFAHVVFQFRGELVSLLVTERRGLARLPVPDHVPSPLDGMPVVSFASRDHVVFVTGTVGETDLRALASAVEGPLTAAL